MAPGRLTFMAAGLLLLVGTAADSGAQPALGCLAFERIGCGCSVSLDQPACPVPGASRVHLHSGATDGAPLWLVLDGHEVELRSRTPPSDSFSFSEGDAWSESYEDGDVAVTLAYRPGPSTCTKAAPEPCEYFDVDVRVTIASGGRSTPYRGRGTCGC